jgi:hypothetical protein
MITRLKDDPVLYITNLYETLKRWREPFEKRWKRFYKLYRGYRDPTDFPFKSNIFVPFTFSIIESVVPKMLGTLFNVRPVISVTPRHGASVELARLLERLLDYQLEDERLEFFNKILEFFKETAIYGTAFAKIVPKFEDDEESSFSYIDIEPIDIFHVFPDYRAKSVRRMKYLIQLSYMDFDELEEMERKGFYKNVKDVEHRVESMASVDSYKRKRLSDVGILDEYGFDPNRRIVEVLEYWDREKIYTIGARHVVLKEENNPFNGLIPFIMSRYCPVQHELYGIGIPEMAESLQEELNTVRNQRMDNVNIIINRMFIANKYADIDFDQLVSYPGNVILTNDINAIKPLDTNDVTKSAYLEEETIKRDIENATGEWGYSRGETPARRETATGIVRLQQATNIRFDTVIKIIEFTVLRNIAKTALWLDREFMPPEEFARIVGPEEFAKYGGQAFYELPITDVLKMYHFMPMGSSTTAIKEIRIQQIMQAFQLFNNDPLIDQMELRKMVLDVLDIKNVDKLLIDPQKLMMAQQAQQMQGQMPPQGAEGEGGEEAGVSLPGMAGVPPPPQPPEPGIRPVPAERQMAELARVVGGGLIKGGPATPQNVG